MVFPLIKNGAGYNFGESIFLQTMGRDPKVSRKNLAVGLLEVHPLLMNFNQLVFYLGDFFRWLLVFPSLFSSNEASLL